MSTKLLREKRALVELARRFGQEPAPLLMEQIAELEIEEQRRAEREAGIRERIAQDINEMFTVEVKDELVQAPSIEEPIAESIEPQATKSQPIESTADLVAKVIRESTIVNAEPALAQPQKDLEREIKYLRDWIGRIAATGPGGGAAQVYNLDYPTKSVTGDYTIGRKDYYIGGSSSVKTYITLPTLDNNLKNGRVVIVKDESGHAQLTPIKLVGTIDNDPNGAEIRINNGAVQLVYHNGCWRIV